MRIGELSARTGVPVDTLRYYETRGLLAPPRRTPGGFRDYDATAVARLAAIGRAKALGFTLAETAALLRLGGDPGADASAVRARAAARLAETEAALTEMQARRDALRDLVDACGGADVARSGCPILGEILSSEAPWNSRPGSRA